MQHNYIKLDLKWLTKIQTNSFWETTSTATHWKYKLIRLTVIMTFWTQQNPELLLITFSDMSICKEKFVTKNPAKVDQKMLVLVGSQWS